MLVLSKDLQLITLTRILFGFFLTTFPYLAFGPRNYELGLSTGNTQAKSRYPRLNNHVKEYYDCCFVILFGYDKCNSSCKKTNYYYVCERRKRMARLIYRNHLHDFFTKSLFYEYCNFCCVSCFFCLLFFSV